MKAAVEKEKGSTFPAANQKVIFQGKVSVAALIDGCQGTQCCSFAYCALPHHNSAA